MKIKLFIIIFVLSSIFINSQSNNYLIKLSQKDLATFNDGISLIRLLYDEEDNDASFINNILWAAEKKLFQVKIPIEPNTINPVLTRREFAFWICKVFNTKGGIVNTNYLNRYFAYKKIIRLGIIEKGRGPYDTFTGQELLDSFSYLDYFVRYYKIKPRSGDLEIYDKAYEDLPLWRKKLYEELERHKAEEKAKREEKKNKRKQNINKSKKEIEKDTINEKFIDKEKAVE